MTSRSRVLLLAGLLAISGAASAAPLGPGELLHPVPGRLADIQTGELLATQISPFIAKTFAGSLVSSVFRGEEGNPFPGGLTFRYRLQNDLGHSIDRFAVNGFEGFLLDVLLENHGPYIGGAPSFADRETTGSSIGFSFAALPPLISELAPGQSTPWLVVHTNATSFNQSSAFALDGSVGEMVAYAPIPEPGSIALALTGVCLSGVWLWRRTRRAASANRQPAV